MPIKRGEVYVADLSGSIGSEQTGTRPVVIVQNDIGNQHSPTVIVACITTKAKKTGMPTHIMVRMSEGSLCRRSMIMAEQLRTIDRKRLRDRIGTVDDLTQQQIDKAISISLALGEENKHIYQL